MQLISREDGNAVIDLYFNDLIDEKVLRSEIGKKTIQELPLSRGHTRFVLVNCRGSPFKITRFEDFTFTPCWESFLGRPRSG